VLLAIACVAFAGCGGDDEKESASTPAPAAKPPPQAPQPKQDIAEFARLLETAITSPGCPGLKTKVNKPDVGGVALTCPADDARVAKALAGYETTGTETYGSGAVIDYIAAEAPEGGTWELSLGGDGTWVLDSGSITAEKTVGTVLESRVGYERALDGFLDAVREGNCDGFVRYALTTRRDKAEACARELPFYDGLATALQADPDAAPFFIGGNARYAFYGLETSKPEPAYRTATVVRTTAEGAEEPYLVARTKQGPKP